LIVTVKFVGSLRTSAGKGRFTLRLGKATPLKEAMEKMAEEAPKLKPTFDNARAGMLILVNGKETSVLNGLDTVLKEGDEVVLVPVVHGG
jgi:molybdopterin converting factor small subunit